MTASLQLLGLVLCGACLCSIWRSPCEPQAFEGPADTGETETATTCAGCGSKWGYALLYLVNDGLVQRELKLTEEQKHGITKLNHQYMESVLALQRGIQHADAPSQPQERASSTFPKKHKQVVERVGKEAVGLLRDEQQKRLAQIVIQLRSVEILYYPEIADSLQLTDEQRSRIGDIRSWTIREARRLNAEIKVKQRNKELFELHVDKMFEEGERRAVELLTPQQRTQFEALQGPSIGFSRRHLRLEMSGKAPAATDGSRGQ